MRTGVRGTIAAGMLAGGLLFGAPAAHAGVPLKRPASCPGQDLPHRSSADDVRSSAAVVCLIGRIRRSQGLNVLRRDPRLAQAAQGHSVTRARTGQRGHGGEPNVVIPRRTEQAGDRAACPSS